MLNKEQQDAYDRLVSFVCSPEHAIILDGSGGTGKSYLINHFKKNIIKDYKDMCDLLGISNKKLDIVTTATTNKAVESLQNYLGEPAQTIHNFLGLKVTNKSDGDSKLECVKERYIANSPNITTIIIIDECSMINWELFSYIEKFAGNAKIIYVGDWCQLPPVKESISKVYKQGYSIVELNKIMRTSETELYNLNKQVKQFVIDQKPITITTGSKVKKLDDADAMKYINANFSNKDNENLIVSYTNHTSIQYNKFVNQIRGNTTNLVANEHYICNNVVHNLYAGTANIKTDSEITITKVSKPMKLYKFCKENTTVVYDFSSIDTDMCICKYIDSLGCSGEILTFVDPEDYNTILAYLRKRKDWKAFYFIKDYFADLRHRDSCTVHKSQGSTVNDIFIDLDDLMTCRQPDMVRRLLYVAISRARNNVYLYGNLKEKYGVIV